MFLLDAISAGPIQQSSTPTDKIGIFIAILAISLLLIIIINVFKK